MKAIKFRAWHNPTRRMLYFDELWICTEYDSIAFTLNERSQTETYKLLAGHSFLPSREESEYIPMQCIGLKDTDGKEIYEGDIVESDGFGDYGEPVRVKQVVEFDDDIDTDKGWETCAGWLIERNSNMVVVGNIYENADLISRGKDA